MALSIEGTVKQINPLETGEGKNGMWSKREFILEFQDGNYPKMIAFIGMKDKADQIGQLVVGQKIRVHFNPSSREYNGRWYSQNDMWKYETIGGSTATAPTHSASPSSGNADDLDFDGNPTSKNSATDDLPFKHRMNYSTGI